MVIDKIVTFRFCSKGDQNVIQPGELAKSNLWISAKLQVSYSASLQGPCYCRLRFIFDSCYSSTFVLSVFRGLISSAICWSGSTAAVQFHRNPCFVCSMVVIYMRAENRMIPRYSLSSEKPCRFFPFVYRVELSFPAFLILRKVLLTWLHNVLWPKATLSNAVSLMYNGKWSLSYQSLEEQTSCSYFREK